MQAAIFQRDEMKPGQHIKGPAVITEDETTIVIPSSRQAIAQPDGCIGAVALGSDEYGPMGEQQALGASFSALS